MTRYTNDRPGAGESHLGRIAMIVFGLTFLGSCVAFVVLAAGEILG